jgi:hypothetical protein
MPLAIIGFIFTTWWSALGVGAAAASIPVIIHLLNRRRFKVVVWAAMRFLLAAEKQNTRRMRLEQLLLLAVRTMLLLLVVLAMASVMPWAESIWAHFWPDGAARMTVRAGRTHEILVIDGSLSMALKKKGEDTTAFERARARAIEMIREAPSGDGFSVVLMTGSSPRRLGLKPSQHKDNLIREIEDKLKTHPHGNADVPATLNMVTRMLQESAGKYEATEVYFLTDLQQATWVVTPPAKSPATAEPAKGENVGVREAGSGEPFNPLRRIQNAALTVFVDVGRDGVNNLAVTDLQLGRPFATTGRPVPVFIKVKNYGTRSRTGAHLDLLVSRARRTADDTARNDDSPPVARAVFDLKENEETTLPFSIQFKEPGDFAVRARLEPDDLMLDNSRAVIVTVKKEIPVLIVSGKGADVPFEGAAEYLSKALNPAADGAAAADLAALFPARPHIVTEARFSDLSEQQLDAYDCIFLCDVDRPDSTETRRLKAHLLRGGGVVFCLGPAMARHLDLYNKILFEDGQGILPARLTQIQVAPEDHYFAFDLSKARFQEPPLKAFDSEDGRLALSAVRFRQYIQAKVVPNREVHSVLVFHPGRYDTKQKVEARLPVGDPAILAWQPILPKRAEAAGGVPDRRADEAGGDGALRRRPVSLYRGRVGLITTSLNMSWTTWPASPSYLPMVQEMLHLASAGRLKEQALQVGEPIEEHLQAVGEKTVVVRAPGRKPQTSRTQLTEDASVFRWSDTDTSGIYRVAIGDDPVERLYAVNVPVGGAGQLGSESDFTRPRCTEALLKSIYPGGNLQVIKDPDSLNRRLGPQAGTDADDETQVVKGRVGPVIARWLLLAALVLLLIEVVLAWHFGHYSSVSGTAGSPPAAGRLLPGTIAVVSGLAFLGVFSMLFLSQREESTLRFLPEGVHAFLEEQLDIPPAADGEANTLKLEFASYLGLGDDEAWLSGAILLAAAALVVMIYLREGRTAGTGYRLLLAGLRLFMIALTLLVLLPQLQLRSERRGWPDLAILIDTSGSMGEPDTYQDPETRSAADRLTDLLKAHLQKLLPARIEELKRRHQETGKQVDEAQAELARHAEDDRAARKLDRLRDRSEALAQKIKYFEGQQAALKDVSWQPGRLLLVQALLTLQNRDWIATLVKQRRMKVHLYHLDRAGKAVALAEVSTAGNNRPHQEATDKIWELSPDAQTSPLGTAVRKLLDDFGTSSLTAVIALTDGITVEGKDSDKKEDLAQVARYANVKGVPLFFVALGDAHGLRDLRLVSLDVPDQVHVNDTVQFEAVVKGYKESEAPVKLYEKMPDGTLVERAPPVTAKIDARGNPVRVKLHYQPKEEGDRVFVVRLEVPAPKDPKHAPRLDYLQLQRRVRVEASKPVKVLYIEGMPRYEFRYVKSLLERESGEEKANKTIDLNVVLLDADEDYAREDKTARQFVPPRPELFLYDVIILGDVDPQHIKIKDHVDDLKDFVLVRGGGMLFVAGPDHNPHSFAASALGDVLPIETERDRPRDVEPLLTGFKPALTPDGQLQPPFRFSSDEGENQAIWSHLAPLFWHARGYKPKPAARVWAVHPVDKHPLVVHQHAGSGRTMFFGFDETWRWRFREDEMRFNQVWIQTMRYLAVVPSNRPELRLNKQTPYTRGEMIKVSVRFPDAAPVQDLKEQVHVTWKRTPFPAGGRTPPPDSAQTLKLAKQEGARALYEGWVSRTREGKYLFEMELRDGAKSARLTAECEVRPPEAEMERLSTDLANMTRAVELQAAIGIRGGVYTLDKADKLLDDIPEGLRTRLDNPRPPVLVWNYVLVFVLVLFLLSSEWILRKRKHLL